MFLKKGERGLLLGQTGSGKTQNGLFHLQNAPVWPVIIFDTKIEDSFFSLPTEDETLEVCNNFEEFERMSKRPKKDLPDYILVRPESWEVVEFEPLDRYLQLCYRKFGSHFIYLDETYNWHNHGQASPGLLELLTRGRSKGKTTLMGSQRPSWISRFCFTESQKFYVHRLLDLRDRKTLDSVIPNFSQLALPSKYHFWHFETGEHESPVLFKPVPETKIEPSKIFRKRWL